MFLKTMTDFSHPQTNGSRQISPVARSWVHLVAGGIGGMTATVLTSPLDVLRTRLQSEYYQTRRTQPELRPLSASLAFSSQHRVNNTFHLLLDAIRTEGWRTLFKGLGPNLSGIIPASAIKFYTYSNCKRLMSELNGGRESVYVHLIAAASAGVTVSTATNPIWVVKTRMQLDQTDSESTGSVQRRYKNSYDCTRKIIRQEGLQTLYRGLSASYLGVIESTLHWALYEQMKMYIAKHDNESTRKSKSGTQVWSEKTVAAGIAKLIATGVAYPHEVIRTRLRQAPMNHNSRKYTGLIQCFRTILKEEGMAALYGGLTPHVLRAVPSSAIMFGVYELVLGLLSGRP